jgi:predicted metal-binding membrane protein
MQESLPQRDKWLIISILLILSLAAWLVTAYQARSHAVMARSSMASSAAGPSGQTPPEMAMPGMSMPSMAMDTPSTANMPGSAALDAIVFLVMWIAMMVAMMFPSVYPMVLLFARVSAGQATQSGRPLIPTWIFVAGYLAIWTAVGGVMYLGDLGIRWFGTHVVGGGQWLAIGSGLVLIGAGLYQWSRWKGVCLTHCRSPLSFILHKWREGAFGAWLMGVDHGAYCVGCCWGLMVVMFAMGVMNIAWMGLLTVVIFAEKVTRAGPLISKLVGGIFIVLGIGLLIDPSLLPRLTG